MCSGLTSGRNTSLLERTAIAERQRDELQGHVRMLEERHNTDLAELEEMQKALLEAQQARKVTESKIIKCDAHIKSMEVPAVRGALLTRPRRRSSSAPMRACAGATRR